MMTAGDDEDDDERRPSEAGRSFVKLAAFAQAIQPIPPPSNKLINPPLRQK